MNLRLLHAIVLAALLAPWGISSADEPPARLAPARAPSSTSFEKEVIPFLARHCCSCHGGGKSKGELALDKYRNVKELLKDREVWETATDMVRTGEMPPKAKDQPRPNPSEAEAAMTAGDTILEEFDCGGVREYGRVTIRRLNRTEYNNSIRDLVGVDFKPSADFPNDDVGYGFDNIGDVLTVSPLLLEKYLSAAETIFEHAIVIADTPKPKKEHLGSPQPSFGAGGERRAGGQFLHGKGQIAGQIYLDDGGYTVRAEVFGQQLGDELVRAVLRVSGQDVKEFEITATDAKPDTIEANVRIKGGSRTIAVGFLNPFNPYIEPPKPGEERRPEPVPPKGTAANHLSCVRELELRIARAETLPPVQPPEDAVRPSGMPAELSEHIRLICDLMVMAFQSDVTRVITCVFAREGSEQKYRMIGVNEGYHELTLHRNDPEKIAKVRKINMYHVEQYADLIGKLKSVPEGDGSLLDSCMIAYGSGNSDGNRHTYEALPLLLAGKGGGSLKAGRHIRYPKETPVNNLWLAMLDRMGAPTETLCDSTGILPGLS